jgi:hypothetical protein
MDIAKYIGLYLLKNKYCCLQGLGNVEIKKTTAQHDGKELISPSYYAVLNPVGSIDDAFPNFVANSEHVSIAKATNEISEFIKASKARMAAGEPIIIPSVGQYSLQNNRLHFELDSAFSLPSKSIPFPILETPKPIVETKQEKEEPTYESYNNYNKSSVNWNIVALWGVIIIIGGSIIGWGIRYFINQQKQMPEITEQVQTHSAPIAEEPVLIDSTLFQAKQDSTASTTPINSSDTPSFKFIIKEYSSLAKAEKRQKQLTSFGYTVSVVNKDTSTFYVVSTIKTFASDTTRIKDSLGKLLNPGGVRMMP